MAARSRDITVRLVSSGAEKTARDLALVGSHAGKMDTALTKASGGFGRLASGARALGTINPIFGQLSSGLDQFGTKLGKVESQAGGAGGGLAAGLAGGANIATGALVALAAIGVKSLVDVAASVRLVQRVSGLGAEDASRLAFAFKEMGIDADTGATGIFRFGKNLSTSTAKIQAFGVAIAYTKTGQRDILGTLLNVSDAYNKLSDQTERNALVQAAFGKGGLALIPILQRGRTGLKEFFDEAKKSGLVFDQKQLTQARDFSIALRTLEASGQGLAISLAGGVTPAITALVHAITPMLQLLTRTHILTGLLAVLVATKLASGLNTAAAAGEAWAASLGLVGASEAQVAAGAAASAVAIKTEGVAAGTTAAELGALYTTQGAGAASAAAMATSVGMLGLRLAGLAVTFVLVKAVMDTFSNSSGKDAKRVIGEIAAVTNDQLAKALDPSGFKQYWDAWGRDVNKAIQSTEEFAKIAAASLPTAQRILNAYKVSAAVSGGGVDPKEAKKIAEMQAAIDRATKAQRENAIATGVATGSMNEFGQVIDAEGNIIDVTTSKLTAAAQAAQDFAKALDSGVNLSLDAAASGRSYNTEIQKYNDLLASPVIDEHAKRLEDLTKAQISAERAAQSLTDAQKKLTDVRAEDVGLLQAQGRLEVERAKIGEGTAAKTLKDALEHQRRVVAAGHDPTDANLAVASAQLGVADAAKQRTDAEKKLNEIPIQHQRDLRDAVLGVKEAQLAVKDAQKAVKDAYISALQPTHELADRERDLADQMDRVIKAAEADVGALIAAGLLPANQAVSALLDLLNALPPGLLNLPAVQNVINTISPPRLSEGKLAGGRARGGYVGGGNYLVGDPGPHTEVLSLASGSSGWVYPAGHPVTRSALASRAFGGPVGSWSGTRVYGGDGAAVGGHVTHEHYEFGEKSITADMDYREIERQARREARRRSASKASRGG